MYSSTVTQYEEPRKDKIEKIEEIEKSDEEPTQLPCKEDGEQPLIWLNIIGIAVLHVLALYAFIFHYNLAKWQTWVFSSAWGITAGVGITAGLHRLWAHRSYSAKLPLRILLAVLYCMAGQTHFYKWIRDHRTHHKFTDSAADPHDANRGFFFSHVGWLMMKRHPAVIKYGKKIDMSDIEADPVICFFDKYYEWIMCTLAFVVPALIPVYFWNESWYIATHAVIIRYVWLLNATFLVNSFAHMWGNKPYNKSFKSTENATVSFFALGEGWHNYHHSFPWDYKAAELGSYGLNPSTAFIELMAKIGWAYDLKTPSKELVEKVCLGKGDGTASKWGNDYHSKQHQKLH
ncbi:acyl-CoA Delta(11) desaturase-like [Copidosoma floridanum]|uniref:acyl-CoA Delta(11) desaturase-like n=1 Tax=Copidosoma floridanum TaxID=29053 RepID=UPI0006C97025|nr:acyl-CoA Delta(11) desaturase-like [Copidosoma floridanum]XP_014209580.1 acyl-CoA Delta(11) desaturase-like [Copidosoma floridanum]